MGLIVKRNFGDLRRLPLGKPVTIIVNPGGHKVFGIPHVVVPDFDHPHWGSIYDQNGKLMASASYGQWFDFEYGHDDPEEPSFMGKTEALAIVKKLSTNPEWLKGNERKALQVIVDYVAELEGQNEKLHNKGVTSVIDSLNLEDK